MLIEVFAQALVYELLHLAFDIAIQLAFGLPFELRLRQLYGYHGDQAFANVISGNRNAVFLFPEHARGAGEIIEGARERGTKARKMRAAIDCVDRIGESKDVFGIAVVILQRDFHLEVIAFGFDINR